jgi:hypothetical protein
MVTFTATAMVLNTTGDCFHDTLSPFSSHWLLYKTITHTLLLLLHTFEAILAAHHPHCCLWRLAFTNISLSSLFDNSQRSKIPGLGCKTIPYTYTETHAGLRCSIFTLSFVPHSCTLRKRAFNPPTSKHDLFVQSSTWP